jgi:hypothetical protein
MDVRLISKLVRVSAALLLILVLLPGAGGMSEAAETLPPEDLPFAAPPDVVCGGVNPTDAPIPDGLGGCGAWVSSAFSASACAFCTPNPVVSSVVVSFLVRHTCPSDLEIQVCDGTGTCATVWNRAGLCHPDDIMVTDLALNHFNGHAVNQTWKLWARDCASGDGGYIDDFAIYIHYVPPVPPAPALLTPDNGSSTCDPTPDFCWNPSPGSVMSMLVVSADPNTSPWSLAHSTRASCATWTAPLTPGVYYWKVSEAGACGFYGPWSEQRTLTVVWPPPAPALSSPIHGSAACNTMPTFQWNAASGATSYRLRVDNNADFSSPLVDTTTPRTYYVPPSPLPLGEIYWRVNASNGCGGSLSSPIWRHTIACQSPLHWLSIPMILRLR